MNPEGQNRLWRVTRAWFRENRGFDTRLAETPLKQGFQDHGCMSKGMVFCVELRPSSKNVGFEVWSSGLVRKLWLFTYVAYALVEHNGFSYVELRCVSKLWFFICGASALVEKCSF